MPFLVDSGIDAVSRDLHGGDRRGLKTVGFCAILKAVGVNLFRATAVRWASNRAAVTGPGPKSLLVQVIFLVKEQMQAFVTAITNFFSYPLSCYPFELKMAA